MSINSFISKVAKQGGMSFSNNFIVRFEGKAAKYFDSEAVEYFCDEAQLPNINTATGNINGIYTGIGSIDYPHTRIFTELQLGFMLDADLSILKSLNKWYGSIFSAVDATEGAPTRVQYHDDYAGTIKIIKTERGPNKEPRKSIEYTLIKAYPYAIDAVPLQFGSSQVTKVTAQFKYERHYTTDLTIQKSRNTSEN